MSKKWFLLVNLLVSFLFTAHAFSNPASTDYVKASLDALRMELNNQSSTQFNEINRTTAQLEKALRELPIITHHVGEVFQGGLIFYVDKSQQHGLMVSLHDVGDDLEWRNGEGGERITNAQAHGLSAGEINTRLIIAQQTVDQQEGRFAALVAAQYHIAIDGISPCSSIIQASSPCYGGWYLPSLYELALLYSTLKPLGLGDFQDAMYWSSTEHDAIQAVAFDFASGDSQIRDKSTTASIRAIHSF